MGIFSKIKSALSFSFVVKEDAPPLTPEQQRGLAMGAVYAAQDYLPINALTMDTDPVTAAKVIQGPWGITDAESARSSYAYLLSGGHQTDYRMVLAASAYDRSGSRSEQAISSATLIRETAEAHGTDAAELQGMVMRWGTATYRGLPSQLPQSARDHQPTTIVAWDVARVVHLSRLVLDAGYLGPDEVWGYIAEAVTLSRAAYSSWEEFRDGFLLGRFFWQLVVNANSTDKATSDLQSFAFGAEHLFETEGSPWLTIPW